MFFVLTVVLSFETGCNPAGDVIGSENVFTSDNSKE